MSISRINIYLPVGLKSTWPGEKKGRFPGIPKNPWINEGKKPVNPLYCTIS